MDYKKILGEKIKEARLDLNLTQDEFAQKLGLTKSQLSKIESGINFTSIPTLIHIKEITGKSFNYFFTPLGEAININIIVNDEGVDNHELASLFSEEFQENMRKIGKSLNKVTITVKDNRNQ
jgi:transcriptional regulator with XRE-family HTH domain